MFNMDQMHNPNQPSVNQIKPQEHEATLMIFSPREIPPQVIRPYSWEPKQKLIDQMINSPSGLQEAVGWTPQGMTPEVATSIIPAEQPIEYNTRSLSESWTFLMVVDTDKRGAGEGGVYRQIYGGYFEGEPVNPQSVHNTNPAYNENSRLIITHSSGTMLRSHIGALGTKEELAVRNSANTTPMSTMQYANDDIYKMDPVSLLQYTSGANTHNQVTMYGPLNVANGDEAANRQGHSMTTSVERKNPRQQLIAVASAVEHSESIGDHGSVSNNIVSGALGGNYDEMQQGAMVNSLNDNASLLWLSGALDPGRSYILSELDRMFPNLTMIPFVGEKYSQWDLYDQRLTSPKNMACSLIYNVVDSSASLSGLSEITFRYNSWMRPDPMGPVGAWEVSHAVTVMKAPDHIIKNAINLFQRTIENDLFFMLKMLVGEFDVMMHYSHGGTTLINLKLEDHPSMSEGIYEVCGAMGGMLNPGIGTASHLEHNSHALNEFIFGLKGAPPYNAESIGYESVPDNSHDLAFSRNLSADDFSEAFNNEFENLEKNDYMDFGIPNNENEEAEILNNDHEEINFPGFRHWHKPSKSDNSDINT